MNYMGTGSTRNEIALGCLVVRACELASLLAEEVNAERDGELTVKRLRTAADAMQLFVGHPAEWAFTLEALRLVRLLEPWPAAGRTQRALDVVRVCNGLRAEAVTRGWLTAEACEPEDIDADALDLAIAREADIMRRRIDAAFKASGLGDLHEPGQEAELREGQWWVRCKRCGTRWSVKPWPGGVDGPDFEVDAIQGEDDCGTRPTDPGPSQNEDQAREHQ